MTKAGRVLILTFAVIILDDKHYSSHQIHTWTYEYINK